MGQVPWLCRLDLARGLGVSTSDLEVNSGDQELRSSLPS